MASQAPTASNYPDYYHEVVNFRTNGFQVDPKDQICVRFVPSKNEMNAVYNTPLSNLLSKKQLPFAVKVTRNFSVAGNNQDGVNLKAGSKLLLYFIVRPQRVYATNPERKDVVLPIHAEQLYEVLPIDPEHDGKVFYGTAEVIKSNPLPKRLRILDAIYSSVPEEAQEKGEIVEVSHVEKRGNIKVLVGRSSLTKQTFAFSELMKHSNYSAMISEEHLTLSNIVKKFKLPLRVRKVGEKKSFMLNEVREEAQVICTDPDSKQVFSLALTCPVHLEYMPIENQGVEAILKATVPQLYPLLNWTWGVTEIGRGPLSTQQRQTPQPLLGVLCHWLNSKDGLELISMATEGSIQAEKAKNLTLQNKIRKLERELSQSRQPSPAIPPRQPTTSNRNAPRSVGRQTQGEASSVYEAVTPTPAPRPRPPSKPEPEKKQEEIEKLKRKIESQQDKISELTMEVSRLRERSYVVPVDIHAFSDRCEENILDFLDQIGLSAYKEKFQEERIDGALLCDLIKDAEEIFVTELKMKKLHARKLIVEIKKRL